MKTNVYDFNLFSLPKQGKRKLNPNNIDKKTYAQLSEVKIQLQMPTVDGPTHSLVAPASSGGTKAGVYLCTHYTVWEECPGL